MNKITLGFFMTTNKTTIKRLLLLFVLLLMNAQTIFAATYYSQGNLAPNLVTSWNTNRLGGGTSPTVFSAGDIFIIQGTGNGGTSPHSMTTSAGWSVSGASSKVWIENAGVLTATFLVTCNAATTFQIDNGGSYFANAALSSAILGGTEVFGASSNFTYNFAPTGTSLPSSPGYGNLTINTTTSGTAVGWGGNITQVQGNLNVTATGTGTIRQALTSATVGLVVNVGGNFTLSGTNTNFWFSSGSGSVVMTVAGDVSISDSALLDLSNSATGGASTLNIGGNFNQTGGTVKSTSSNPSSINFTGVGKTFTQSAGILTNTNINWAVNSGASLTLNNAFIVAANRTLNLSGAIATSSATTINGSLQINQGGSATGGTWTYGPVGALIFNNSSGSYAVGSDVLWPTTSGPANVIVQGAGGVTINSAKTILNDLTISSGAVILNADVAVNNNLTVNFGSIIVSSDKKLTVKNNIINNAGITDIIIENNANLIQDLSTTVNTNIGEITVKRNSNDLKRLDYTLWSSPVASQNLFDFSPLTISTRFYSYDNTAGTSGLYSEIANPASNSFASGAGYLIRMPNEDPSNLGPLSTYASGSSSLTYNGIFAGVPNNGDVPVTLNYGVDAAHAYNLVGNPYPSTIDANAFITANSANIESTLYFWRKTNGSGTAYAAYNPAGGVLTYPSTTSGTPNGTIQVGQGFFVQAKSAGLITNFFTNAMRLGTSSTQFFKTKQVVEKNRIWLNLTNTSGVFSQTLVGYITDASLGLDIYDGRYINDSPIALTSNINNEEYTIQGRPAFDASDVVPLNFKTDVTGDYTIAIDHTDGLFATGQDVYLVDNTTGAETNLKTDVYTFSAAAGLANARFSMKYQKTLKVDAPEFNDNSVTVYKSKGTLFVNSGAIAISNIKVFDIQGRIIVEQKNVKANSATINNLKATQQVLIVKVTGKDNSVVSKKVVN